MEQEKIGKFIAKRRKDLHFTQANLAKKLGITDRAVSKWENGKSIPDASLMLDLCQLLEIKATLQGRTPTQIAQPVKKNPKK